MDTFSGNLFDWKRGIGHTTLSKLGLNKFPKTFSIRSERTGITKSFCVDADTMEANEFFDGEATAYHDGEHKVQVWA